MAEFDIKSFSSEDVAKSYFKNVIVEDSGKAGFIIKAASNVTYQHDNGTIEDIGPDKEVYIVVRVAPGTKIEADQIMIESKIA
ncbi:MAG: hypothetical protein NBV68_05870 [Erythrobacter sp.]|uniref:hypothetical protein n=1 Tax=Erythrobacter sp. TaxID=1042 RepID=UPI0025EC6CCE|nr:hypothetical protein [Erythrobacter sp.]MCL9998888.1 hypothetical protein [Erythrobacter sp.]